MLVRIDCEIGDGLAPCERAVRIRTADGRLEEAPVPVQAIEDGRLVAMVVDQSQGGEWLLVELPRETVSGRWRIWIENPAIKREAGE